MWTLGWRRKQPVHPNVVVPLERMARIDTLASNERDMRETNCRAVTGTMPYTTEPPEVSEWASVNGSIQTPPSERPVDWDPELPIQRSDSTSYRQQLACHDERDADTELENAAPFRSGVST
jgi:hypothetical protein